MSTQEQVRNRDVGKPGHPTQFAPHQHGAPEVALPGAAERMRQQLLADGYVSTTTTIGVEETGRDAEGWWDRPTADAGGYPVLPETVAGRAHRNHRSLFEGNGVRVRMPAVSAIKRFAKETEGTFDVPFSAETPAGPVDGFVRVTNNRPGFWSVSGVELEPTQNAYVSEAIQAVLEARRPRVALSEARDILARRRERLEAAGVKLRPTTQSDWLTAIGFNPFGNQLVVQMGDRVYGYRADAAAYEALRDAYSPGRAYNSFIKGRQRFELAFHERCGAYYNAKLKHRCSGAHLPA